MNTCIYRDTRDGWKADTTLDTPDGAWQLSLRTRVRAGVMSTHAAVGKIGRGGVTHRLYSDFASWRVQERARGTEKAVTAQHEAVLATLPAIWVEVIEHYLTRGEVPPTFHDARHETAGGEASRDTGMPPRHEAVGGEASRDTGMPPRHESGVV